MHPKSKNMDIMNYIPRLIENKIRHTINRNKSVLLFGARQTGKTTLTSRFNADFSLSFALPDIRQRYEKMPALLKGEVEALSAGGKFSAAKPLVVLDEVQKIPVILDVVQDLIDRGRANFILTGSSVRKLRRRTEINFLPGRVVTCRLDPFSLRELPDKELTEYLIYGSLPGINAVSDPVDKETDLESYVTTYLEEEIRAESIVRHLGHFARFLELAASESGRIINLRKLSQEIGVSHATIGSYYQILEDCLVVERIEPLTRSKTRKKLTKSERFLFFDLGVRRVAAKEGTKLPRDTMGSIFEQFVGLELLRGARISKGETKIRFWRDPDGPEIDWVIDKNGLYTPIEVKLTDNPLREDTRYLRTFLSEYASAQEGYIVCQAARRVKIGEKITAVPWQEINELL
jgi:predicted AAA+ superfamily ATPase